MSERERRRLEIFDKHIPQLFEIANDGGLPPVWKFNQMSGILNEITWALEALEKEINDGKTMG